jgi:hypothetical protein
MSHAKTKILKVAHDEEEGTIKLRWRVAGITSAKSFQPWKIKLWSLRQSVKDHVV